MASPASRAQLKDYCLRKLGFPVIDLNLDEDQIDDRIDDALQKFREFHYDGTEEIYLAHEVTANNISQGYVDVSDNIIGVTRLMPVGGGSISSSSSQGFNIFDINYQIRLNDFYNLLASSYTYFVIARQHLAMLDMIITGEIPFTFSKTTNRINVQMDWSGRLNAGDYIVFQAIRIVDPDTYSKVFNDFWLKNYATALIKRQWGSNLTKYANYTLPGGLTVNGEKIYADAVEEVEKLEAELRDVYEAPPQMIVG
jgi:hypothetical protein